MQTHTGASNSGSGSGSGCHQVSGALTVDRFNFPPGYRFKPTDEDLIVHYLRKKVDSQPLPPNHILEVDVYDEEHHPDKLFEMYKPRAGEHCYFFTSRKKKYPNGQRPDRAAGKGYWKATSADKDICFDGVKVGSKKALVFYMGKPPRGIKTDWLMQEYTVPSSQPISRNTMRLDYCLCEIYRNSERRSHQTRHNSSSTHETNRTLDRVDGEDLHEAEQMETIGNNSNNIANVEPLAIMYASHGNYQAPNNLDFNYLNHYPLHSTTNTSFDFDHPRNVNVTELPVLLPPQAQLSAQHYIATQDPSMGINMVSDQMFDWGSNFGRMVLQLPPPPLMECTTPSLAERNLSAEQSNNGSEALNSTETNMKQEGPDHEGSNSGGVLEDEHILPSPENDILIEAYYENYFADTDASCSFPFNFCK